MYSELSRLKEAISNDGLCTCTIFAYTSIHDSSGISEIQDDLRRDL